MTTNAETGPPTEREWLEGLRYEDRHPNSEMHVQRVGYLCIQGHPNRICMGCTSACAEPVYVEAAEQ